jgi:hypothetical protein
MIHPSLRPYYLVGAMIAALLAVAAGAGLADPGIYRPFLSPPLVAFQYLQDLASLAAAPLLLAAMYLTSRGSLRAFAAWNGLLIYVGYYYAFLAFDFVYSAFYPLYLALVGLSIASLIGLLAGADLALFRARVSDRMPARFIAAVLGSAALFDLCFLIPAMVFAAAQIWRRRPLGYLLGGALLVKATISGLLLTGGELLSMQRGRPPALDQLAMYVFLGAAGMAGLFFYLRNLRDQPGQPGPAPGRRVEPRAL